MCVEEPNPLWDRVTIISPGTQVNAGVAKRGNQISVQPVVDVGTVPYVIQEGNVVSAAPGRARRVGLRTTAVGFHAIEHRQITEDGWDALVERG